MTFLDSLRQRSQWILLFACLVLVALIAVCDYLTGTQFTFTFFYLLPITLITWTSGRPAGIVISVASTVGWLGTDLLSNTHTGIIHPFFFWIDAPHEYPHPWIPFWNAFVNLAFFLVITHILASLRAVLDRQQQMTHFLVHDLRSPLTNVLTGMQTLRNFDEGQLDDESKEIVDLAITSSNRMLSLINSLLDITRLARKHMTLKRAELSTRNLIEASLALVALWAKQNEVNLCYEEEKGLPLLHIDAEITERVLVNVLSNAIKFSPAGSTITVRAVAAGPSHVTVSVTDQGPGISKEWTEKVFDKYAQVEARQSGALVGSGLGLAFSRLAVEAQGGRIWLESEVGKGTTVFFTLPASAAEVARPSLQV